MYSYSNVSTRLDTSTPFYVTPTSFLTYFQTTYVDTGMSISAITELSNDQLSETKTSVWRSEADWEVFTNDPVVREIGAERAAHNLRNGIVLIRHLI